MWVETVNVEDLLLIYSILQMICQNKIWNSLVNFFFLQNVEHYFKTLKEWKRWLIKLIFKKSYFNNNLKK